MKVNVNVTLDIDPEAWATEFGLCRVDNVIRRDVKTYFAGLCTEQLAALGLGNYTGFDTICGGSSTVTYGAVGWRATWELDAREDDDERRCSHEHHAGMHLPPRDRQPRAVLRARGGPRSRLPDPR
jgi:hypothetical protein